MSQTWEACCGYEIYNTLTQDLQSLSSNEDSDIQTADPGMRERGTMETQKQ